MAGSDGTVSPLETESTGTRRPLPAVSQAARRGPLSHRRLLGSRTGGTDDAGQNGPVRCTRRTQAARTGPAADVHDSPIVEILQAARAWAQTDARVTRPGPHGATCRPGQSCMPSRIINTPIRPVRSGIINAHTGSVRQSDEVGGDPVLCAAAAQSRTCPPPTHLSHVT